ncbi:ATP-binding protein [Nocardioides sp.]|uniref:PAS domain-containing sensor histidine kinase n=1 Tax=Nocardioides sp. TaxID=35761 RepID=UPI002716699D|nr:ATP-binding protein [Nocardioides sp.]MDO9458274.1 ATP-binding protein [Nocardioides sp.]
MRSTRLDDREDDPAWTLKLTKARLDSLSDYHPDGVFSLDLEGRFTAVNAEALLQSGGYTAEELLDRSFVDLLLDEDVATVQGYFAGLLDRQASAFEVRFQRADGSIGELEIIGLPIVVDDEVVEVYGIAEDITERKQFQHMLDDARRAAESASEAKSAFLATVSHEIRTPLTSVLAAAEMLGESELTPHQEQLVTLMERSGERLLRLVDEILDFSRIEAGTAEIVTRPFVLADLVDETTVMVRGAFDDKGLAFSCTVDPELPDRLLGDAERIAQVLTNLVDNAGKFTHEGRVEVSVSAEPLDGAVRCGDGTADDGVLGVRFAVTDTGIGLAPDQQAIIFEMFRQADSSVTREYGGTGIGLAISRKLVALMGGELGVVSEQGAGSTFSFVLPLRTP